MEESNATPHALEEGGGEWRDLLQVTSTWFPWQHLRCEGNGIGGAGNGGGHGEEVKGGFGDGVTCSVGHISTFTQQSFISISFNERELHDVKKASLTYHI